MKHLILFFLVILASQYAFSQESNDQYHQRIKWKHQDMMTKMMHNKLTLRFLDALTGDMILNSKITIENKNTYEAIDDGRIIFPLIPDGRYNVSFRSEGYISTDFEMRVISETIFLNIFSVSPKLDLKQIRIVVDWSDAPKDIDAHFVKQNSYHISFRNMKATADGSVKLDRDDTNGYGPETITISDVDDDANYEYYIHDYTNKHSKNNIKLSNSHATIKVYGEDQLLEMFEIPERKAGTVWSVFKIEDGQIIQTNEFKPIE